MKSIYLDSGYSSLKGFHENEWYKIPTSISFLVNTGNKLGDSKNVYEFEGDTYSVGDKTIDENSFSTTDYKFKYKFEPLIIKHFRDVLKVGDDEIPELILSLALVDWGHKDELRDRCSKFEVNGKTIKNNIRIIPQGVGAYYDYVNNTNNRVIPSTAFVIEIGYNTINALYFEDGATNRSKSKGYPNHGVSSIIKPFTQYLENKFSMAFSEQEALKYFIRGKFIYNGELVQEVSDTIEDYKRQFVKRLFNSILVSDRKLISTSEVVIISGGGAYYLSDTVFPPNVKFVDKPYEFSNIRGMISM